MKNGLFALASSINLLGTITPVEIVARRNPSSAFTFLVSKNSGKSAWKMFRYTAPAPGRCPSWSAYWKLISRDLATGKTPLATPSIPLILSERARNLERFNATPPPIFDSCLATPSL